MCLTVADTLGLPLLHDVVVRGRQAGQVWVQGLILHEFLRTSLGTAPGVLALVSPRVATSSRGHCPLGDVVKVCICLITFW